MSGFIYFVQIVFYLHLKDYLEDMGISRYKIYRCTNFAMSMQAIKRNSSTSMDSNDGSSSAVNSKKDIATQTLTKPVVTVRWIHSIND